MKELFLRFCEITKELTQIVIKESKKLFILLKKKYLFMQNKQETLKSMTKPMIEKRTIELSSYEKELRTLCNSAKTLKKEISVMDSELQTITEKLSIIKLPD